MIHNMKVTFTKKRDPERVISGTYYDDGLSSLVAVTCDDGSVEYLSVLDRVISFERLTEDRGEFYLAGSSEARFAR